MSLSISTKKSLNSSTKERRLLVKASKKACITAVKNSKKLGLAITFLENGTIYKELPNDERVAVKKIKKVPNLIDRSYSNSQRHYIKCEILKDLGFFLALMDLENQRYIML